MRLRVVGIALLLVAVIAFPAAFGRYPVKLLQEILIWGIYAMSLDLLMGYAGMVSFGHSAFFGVGGYVAALALTAHPGPVGALLWPALLCVEGDDAPRNQIGRGEKTPFGHARGNGSLGSLGEA